MKLCWYTFGIGTIFSIAALGCGTANEVDIDEAQQPQIMVSEAHDWRLYKFTFTNEQELMRVLVMGDADVGDFKADNEYWYVTANGLQYLGLRDLEAVHTDGDGTPVSESGDQEFMLPVYPTWNTFTSDPVSGGHRYDSGNHHLRIATDSGEITRLTWYQTIVSTGTATNITLDTDVYVGSGAVTVPTGQTGYYIDATIP